jgi:hypothetical protein
MWGSAVAVFCRTKLNYSASSSLPATVIEVDVLDGRTADLPGWAECGFELLSHTSRVSRWDRDDEIVAVHYPEVEALARRITGCAHAMVSSHIKRNPAQAARHRDLAPIRFVHSDFARGHDALIRRAFRDAMDDPAVAVPTRHAVMADTVEHARRVVVVQFWRNLGPPKMDLPLALCDARTVRADEARPFVVTDYAGAGGQFEALAVTAPSDPERHRWYAYPEMTANETIAFRTYDTDIVRAGGTFFTPHTAFRDPEVALDQPARSSIELRATCLFP